jgi:hypothetical protein
MSGPSILWSPNLDALLTKGVLEGGSWQSIANLVSYATGTTVSPEQARSRYRRLSATPQQERVNAAPDVSSVRTAAADNRTREITVLRAALKESEAELAEARELAGLYRAAVDEPIVVPNWRLPDRTIEAGHVGTVMASLADWHLDEVVNPAEINGLNAYNRVIAEQRVRRWMEKLITLPREYMRGLEIEGLIIAATGDLFTGEIHDELKQTNEDKVLASLLYWLEPVIAVVETLASEYPAVEINCVPGNHSRITEKYNHKGRVKESLEQFFWSVVRARLIDRGKAPNVTINVSASSNMNVAVYGRNYVLDHGYEFKGGSGISGAFAPLSLGSARKNIRQTIAGIPMHTMWIGHMHQIINIPGVVMGGCLKGYDEYAFDLNLRPDAEGAGQAMWVTSPERAQVLWMPVYVTKRSEEGW